MSKKRERKFRTGRAKGRGAVRLWDTGARHHGSDIGLGRKNNQMGKIEIVKEVINKFRTRKCHIGEEKTFVQDEHRVEEQCASH